MILFSSIAVKVEKVQNGSPGLYRVTGLMNDGSEVVDEYNTVLFNIQSSCITVVVVISIVIVVSLNNTQMQELVGSKSDRVHF